MFKVTPAGATTLVHSFCYDSGCTDGGRPYAGLFQATNGAFYGTTAFGGDPSCGPGNTDPPGGCGTVFMLSAGLHPFVAFVRSSGKVGSSVAILGQGLDGTTSISFHGTQAAFGVKSATYLTATVPTGATSGFVSVSTPSGMLKSSVTFRVTR